VVLLILQHGVDLLHAYFERFCRAIPSMPFLTEVAPEPADLASCFITQPAIVTYQIRA
jgi:hypothetical protein